MGSQTSKQIIKRKYPSQHMPAVQKFPEATPEGTTSTRARETRDQASIKDDEKNSQLLTNLSVIGQVPISIGPVPLKQSSPSIEILKHRVMNESEFNGNLGPNRLSVQDIRQFLDQRKSPNTSIEELGKQFNLDKETAEILVKHVNTFVTIDEKIGIWVDELKANNSPKSDGDSGR